MIHHNNLHDIFILGYYADVESRCQVFRVCATTDLTGKGKMLGIFVETILVRFGFLICFSVTFFLF